MDEFEGKVAVVTGGASGIGAAMAAAFAARGMKLVLADIEPGPLEETAHALRGDGADVFAVTADVSRAADVERVGQAAIDTFGALHVACNNAGVGSGGATWEVDLSTWEWVLGVNLMGVAHGVRVFTPMMLDAAAADPAWRGHIVNTASMAGLLAPPNMGVYNVSKHAVVALTETLYQDLSLVTDQVSASVLCPFFVPTGISQSHRNRPAELSDRAARPTRSQLIGQAMSDKAVGSGKVSAADVAQLVFDAVAADRFYIYSHPKAIKSVQTRLEDIMQARNPTDPFADKPELGAELRKALRA